MTTVKNPAATCACRSMGAMARPIRALRPRFPSTGEQDWATHSTASAGRSTSKAQVSAAAEPTSVNRTRLRLCRRIPTIDQVRRHTGILDVSRHRRNLFPCWQQCQCECEARHSPRRRGLACSESAFQAAVSAVSRCAPARASCSWPDLCSEDDEPELVLPLSLVPERDPLPA